MYLTDSLKTIHLTFKTIKLCFQNCTKKMRNEYMHWVHFMSFVSHIIWIQSVANDTVVKMYNMYIRNIHFIDKLNTWNTTNNSGSSNLCKWQHSSVKKYIEKKREDHSCKSQVPKSTKSKYRHHYSLLVSYPV